MRRAVLIALSALIVLGGVAATFGMEERSKGLDVMEFTGTPVSLSLDGAVKRMQSEGVDAQNAEVHKKYDQAIAGGYSETVVRLRGEDSDSTTVDTDIYGSEINKDLAAIKRDFAKGNIESNYQADMNRIEQATVETYYNLLLLQDNVTAAEDNLKIQNEMLRLAQSRISVGKLSDNELLSAHTAVKTAENELTSAEASLKKAHMTANIQFGYSVMQPVMLTDTLEETSQALTSLEDAIRAAKSSRLEIKSAELDRQIQETMLSHLKYRTASNSSTYLRQEAAVNQVQQRAKNKPLEIEMEVRSDYLSVIAGKSALNTCKSRLTQAKSDLEVKEISYKIGAAMLSDVQNAQLSVFLAQMSVSSAIKDYNLAVYAYEMAQGVGSTRISL